MNETPTYPSQDFGNPSTGLSKQQERYPIPHFGPRLDSDAREVLGDDMKH